MADMSFEAEPRRYEEECLKELREYYKNPVAVETMRSGGGRLYLDARLEGQYPDTALVVSFRDEHTGIDREVRYGLWGDNWTAWDRSGRRWREPPHDLIMLLTTDLEEPGEPMGS